MLRKQTQHLSATFVKSVTLLLTNTKLDKKLAEIFAAGETVDVTGTSKGKGFRVQSSATTNPADQCHTVHVTTEDRVQWV